MNLKQFISGHLLLIAVCTFSQLAYAALGGSVDTITLDRKALQAVRRSAALHHGYTVEEIVSDATTVREYVSPSGIVFGVAWNGYVHPDLTQLLGTYWVEFLVAQQKSVRKFGRKQLKLTADKIIVEKWGHMRNLRGRAYAPSLVPADVNIDEIK